MVGSHLLREKSSLHICEAKEPERIFNFFGYGFQACQWTLNFYGLMLVAFAVWRVKSPWFLGVTQNFADWRGARVCSASLQFPDEETPVLWSCDQGGLSGGLTQQSWCVVERRWKLVVKLRKTKWQQPSSVFCKACKWMINNCIIISSVGGAVSRVALLLWIDSVAMWTSVGKVLDSEGSTSDRQGGAPAMPTYLVQRACTAMAGTPSRVSKDGRLRTSSKPMFETFPSTSCKKCSNSAFAHFTCLFPVCLKIRWPSNPPKFNGLLLIPGNQ